jgi:hypothetical protein
VSNATLKRRQFDIPKTREIDSIIGLINARLARQAAPGYQIFEPKK